MAVGTQTRTETAATASPNRGILATGVFNVVADGSLEHGRDHFARQDWKAAHRCLSAAGHDAPLDGADLLRLAIAAYLLGRDAESRENLEQAYHAQVAAGRFPEAVHAAFWLVLELVLGGGDAQANGWIARARRLLPHCPPDGAEQVLMLIPEALFQLDADPESALAAATTVLEAGARLRDADLLAFGTPAARFGCHPHLNEDSPRSLAEHGAVLHGRVLESGGSRIRFGDDVARQVAFAEADFDVRFRPMFDAYAAAVGLELPQDPPAPGRGPVPEGEASLEIAVEGISAVVWATGYRLDFSWLGLQILDEWRYPLHHRGVTIQPGLYAIGLPWLHAESSAMIPGVSADSAHLVQEMIAAG